MTKKITLAKAFVAFFVSVLLASCGGNKQAAPQEAPPMEVDFMTLQPSTEHTDKKYPGTIEGSVNVDIKAQVSGYLDQIYVKEGDYVQKGQSLFRIKGDVFKEQVNNSHAAYQAALAAEQTAKIEVEKIRPLVEGKVYSPLQLQTAEANYASAKAQVAQAKAALGSSQINAAFSLIKAPVSGYIGRIPNRIGNLVTQSDPTPLTVLSDINKVFVYFTLSEPDFITFSKDRKQDKGLNTVELIVADGSTYPHKGNLEIASGVIDRNTGTIALKAVFENPDKLLRSGGAGKIVLRKTLGNVLTIPKSSVKDIQDKFFVFALGDSNKITMKPIEIEANVDNNYILKSGLQTGDKLALNRLDALQEGMKVKPVLKDRQP